jgi:hypothetical protein
MARQAKHCGVCVPCVVRRFAVEAAGAQDAIYQHDTLPKAGIACANYGPTASCPLLTSMLT